MWHALKAVCTVAESMINNRWNMLSPVGSAAAGAAAESDTPVDHRFLRCVLDILRAAAELKDADEVRWAGCICGPLLHDTAQGFEVACKKNV